MSRDDAPLATVDDLARRLATDTAVRASVARIHRGRRRRAAVAASVAVLSATALVFGGWTVLERTANPPEPAAPPVEITEAPLEQQLLDAVETGDHRRMEALITAGAYVDQDYPHGDSRYRPDVASLGALAGMACDAEAIRILDEAGAARSVSALVPVDGALLGTIAGGCDAATFFDVLGRTDGSLTRKDIAKAAAESGSLELMGSLAARGYPLENRETGWSTVEDAASEGRTDMVLLLLDLGADPTIEHNQTPLTEWLRIIAARTEIIDAVAAAAESWENRP